MDLSDLFSIYEMEKRNKHKLQKLPESFYKKVSNLINDYKTTLDKLSPDSPQYKKFLLELDNLKELIKNLFYYRVEKMIKMSYFEVKEGIKPSSINNLTKEEEILYNMLISIFSSFRDYMIIPIISGESINIEGFISSVSNKMNKILFKPDLALVIVLKDLEPIIGPNGKTYGPFKKEDLMLLPRDLAKRLEDINICKIVK